jgi:hypothetical protein
MYLLIGFIFIILCKKNVLLEDASSTDVKYYPGGYLGDISATPLEIKDKVYGDPYFKYLMFVNIEKTINCYKNTF